MLDSAAQEIDAKKNDAKKTMPRKSMRKPMPSKDIKIKYRHATDDLPSRQS
jgi:hypothetical protein